MPECQFHDKFRTIPLDIAQSKVAKAVKRHGHKQKEWMSSSSSACKQTPHCAHLCISSLTEQVKSV